VQSMWRSIVQRLVLRRDLTSQVLRLAYPVVLGSLTYTLLSVVDTAMLGRLGPIPLAASGIAGVVFFAIVYGLSSVSVGTQTLVARRCGEEAFGECGHVLQAGIGLALLIAIPLVASSSWIARWLSPLLSTDTHVIEASTTYLYYRLLGAGFMVFSWVFQAFYAGIGQTQHQLIGSILVTLANIVLDYILIFGHAGFPRLGVGGAAIASTIATAIGMTYYAVVLFRARYRRQYNPFGAVRSAGRWLVPILRLSIPILGQRSVEQGSWVIFFTIVARIGTVELAATNVIRSIHHLAIMLAIGLGIATSALVGQSMGAREPDRAERLTWEAVKLASYSMIVVGLLYALFPRIIFSIYTSDPEVIAAGRWPLIFLGLIQAFPGIALVLSQGLQGAGNTRFVMIAEIAVCFGLYLPSVYLLGLRTPLGLLGAWTGELIYWAALALIMVLKFRRGTWKHIQI
jgi:multidrug resistance protein, MATE family